MKIVADNKIPCIVEAMSSLGDVTLLDGRSINQQQLNECDCLLVRTVTHVDEHLLKDTPVKFVGTATIGIDHIDTEWLKERGIGFANAAGCNAEAASEYVISGLFALSEKLDFDPFSMTAGIVGCGNVGSRLKQKLEALGIDTLMNDPPLEREGHSDQSFDSLDHIISQCDFISLHVPLTHSGRDATRHLFNADRLASLKSGCLLVNAARGEVVDNAALSEILRKRTDLKVFLDTWEHEPTISKQLLGQVDLATPHIAGYSVEGRLRGTQMVCDAAHAHFDTDPHWHMEDLLGQAGTLHLQKTTDPLKFWQSLMRQHCNIWRDHEALVNGKNLEPANFAQHFDGLRRVYDDRREYASHQLTGTASQFTETLKQLGFQTICHA